MLGEATKCSWEPVRQLCELVTGQINRAKRIIRNIFNQLPICIAPKRNNKSKIRTTTIERLERKKRIWSKNLLRERCEA